MTPLQEKLAKLTPEQRALFEKRLLEKGISLPSQGSIPLRENEQELLLSSAQERLWFVQQFEPNNTAYNISSALRIKGTLNSEQLTAALTSITTRHEALRTSFHKNAQGQPRQKVHPAQKITLHYQTLSEAEIRDSIITLATQRFDLTEPLLHFTLYQLAPNDHILSFVTHHLVCDRWSVMIFMRELTQLYLARSTPLPTLSIQYPDWALWQREHLNSPTTAKQLTYWKERLRDLPPPLELPSQSSAATTSHSGAHQAIHLGLVLSNKIKTIAGEQKVSLFTFLLAAFKALLHRYSSSTDIIVGSEVANRDHPETAGLIGLFVNTLVLRTSITPEFPFLEHLQRVQKTVEGGLSHQNIPFEKLVEELNPNRKLDQLTPLFQVKFDLQQVQVNHARLGNLTLEQFPIPETQTKYDLRFNLQESEQEIFGQIEYSTTLFDSATMARMTEHFVILLENIVADPQQLLSELEILSPAEKQTLLAQSEGRQLPPSLSTLHGLFEQQVQNSPDAIALYHHSETKTYQELSQQAEDFAAQIRSLELPPNSRIGVCLPKSPALLAAIFGILKSGAAYVPLDPEYPAKRLQDITTDAICAALIEIGPDGPTLVPTAEIPAVEELNSDPLAYVIYTSGSTGHPKGVAISHRAATTLVRWAHDHFSREELAGVLASTSICFDLSIFEIFVPLTTGGAIILADNLLAVPQLPARDQITLLNTVPSLLRQFLLHAPLPHFVRVVNLAGEALPNDLVADLFQQNITRVDNLYGPSEDTTYSTWVTMKKGEFDPQREIVTIGRPIDNTMAYVLDKDLQLQPIGLTGDLYLSGDGLTQGYLHRPELTEAAFITNPHKPNSKLYRTGDRARWSTNGELEFLGRADHQFKIRGYRIEAGEIEIALRTHPAITDTVVMPHRGPDETLLLAYIVPQNPKEPVSLSELRSFLSTRLPSAMIPTIWEFLEEIPRLINGKVNQRDLPKPGILEMGTHYTAPKTPTETKLAELWQELLRRERIGTQDNFFDLGGHSLLAIQLVTRIEQEFYIQLALRELFHYPTIAQLAEVIETSASPADLPSPEAFTLTPDLTQVHQPFPLTDIQQAYWLGRSGAFELGNISTHGYREIDLIGVAHEAVAKAFNQLIRRHGMLRVIVENSGQQRILPEVPDYKISLTSAEDTPPLLRRKALSHQIFETNTWPLFHLEAIQISENTTRYLVSFDVLIGDAWSLQILGREMGKLIMGLSLPPLSLSFRDYVIAEKSWGQSSRAKKDWTYWQERITDLPPAPELPLIKNPRKLKQHKVTRRSIHLTAEQWKKLQKQGRQHQLTPSVIVLAAFAEILGVWSRHQAFTLNLTLFNRPPAHPEIDTVVGDFTSSTLISCDQRETANFSHRAKKIQATLWEALEHRSVSGIQIIRELARQRQSTGEALMPVVFTSTLGQIAATSPDQNWDADVIYAVSQTSQVYFDHQVSEINGELVLNWDVIEEVWPKGVIDEMFATYEQLLNKLASSEQAWSNKESLAPFAPFEKLNLTPSPDFKENDLLHTLFFDQVVSQPDLPALITDEETLSYREVAQQALHLAKELDALSIQQGDLVAICAPRSWQQVVACLAILTAGAAYVPINSNLPQKRRHQLLADSGSRLVITIPGGPNDWPSAIIQIEISRRDVNTEYLQPPTPKAQQSDLAYLIYTSGSTGTPKGVMIDHRGAVNTILDLNKRLHLSSRERLFAISSLSFDLSVYDIFGTLASGAALVIGTNLERAEDPAYWCDLSEKHNVSVWNSVPAIAQLLVSELELRKQRLPKLRAFLLSGDWIPLTLPDALHRQFPSAQSYSLGGATEASIWSIIHPIEDLNPAWPSIPYGLPLTGQTWYVLDENLQPCPPWVAGELYIGGIGVALGYWQRPDLTAQKFIPDPFFPSETARLYRTGDWGRLRPHRNGELCLEFLGREDSQVKINGFRIELGEIESALQRHPALSQAAVTIQGTPPELIAYVVPNKQTLTKLEEKATQPELSPNQSILLPVPKVQTLFKRQSHRQFLDQALSLVEISELLSVASAHSVEGADFPKYQYPSAGSLYAIDLYLIVKPDRVSDLAAGCYRYLPHQHRLQELETNSIPKEVKLTPKNQSIADQSAFTLYLIADFARVESSYPNRANDFCYLEAGYLGQALMEKAPHQNLGLCPINESTFDTLPSQLGLNEDHHCLHAFLGGQIEPSWSERWIAPEQKKGDSLIGKLTSYLAQELPTYMVPRQFQILTTIPLSANGKINHKALPRITTNPESSTSSYQAPATSLEKTIVVIWEDLLQVQQIGLLDNFFQLGGSSLQAIQLLGRLRQEGYPDLTIAQLFESLTPASQAELLLSLKSASDEISSIKKVEREKEQSLSDQEVEAQLRALLEE